MAQVTKVRLPDGRTVRPADWKSTPVYSTVEISETNTNPLAAFSYGVGGKVPGSPGPRTADRKDTNFNGDGSIVQENEELMIFSIAIELFQHTSSNTNFKNGNGDLYYPDPPLVSPAFVAGFQNDCLVVMRIAETKEYLSHPAGWFPAGTGVHMSLGAADTREFNTDHAFHVGFNGGTSPRDTRQLATPHHVRGGEQFEIRFEFPRGAISALDFGADTDARLRARVYADGYRKEPVA